MATKIGGRLYRAVKKRKNGSCRPGAVKKKRKGQVRCWVPVKKNGKARMSGTKKGGRRKTARRAYMKGRRK